MHCVPFELGPADAYPSLEHWLADAPGTVATMLHRWDLTAGEAYIGGMSGSVLRVTDGAGNRFVLKVTYPHVEGVWEAVGLQMFPTDLAPTVLRQDPWTWAMLLTEVTPGTPLASESLPPAEALEIAGRLHHELTAAAAPTELPRLVDAMADYAAAAAHGLAQHTAALHTLGVESLVRDALEALPELSGSGPTTSLLHGDYNPGNILRSPSGWVAIDPKPLVGDPAFDLWPLVTQIGTPLSAADPAGKLRDHLITAARLAQCDWHRTARWAQVRTALNVLWHLTSNEKDIAAADAFALTVWSRIVRG